MTTNTSKRNSSAGRAKRALKRRIVGWRVIVVTLGVVALAVVGGLYAVSSSRPAVVPTPEPTPPPLRANGIVQPIARANVGTINGGIVDQVLVSAGQSVEAKQLLARVNLPGQTELLVAPWAGTVIGVNAHQGDTVIPGTVVFSIGDLAGYQIETTDVDEYLISRVHPGQSVSMTVEALDGARLLGVVKSVSLSQQLSINGDHYPVVIELSGRNSGLRPGMTVRITFIEE